MAFRFVRFGTKVGVFGGAIYYTTQVGLWSDSKKTEELYGDIYKTIAPYVKEVPVEVPELPKVSNMTRTAKQYWNRGVIATGDFVGSLPNTLTSWGTSFYQYVNGQFNDFSAPPKPSSPPS